MKIKTITATIFFEKEKELLNKMEELEKRFPDRFNKPFVKQAVPNQAPANIPRAVTNTRDGLESVTISPINMQYVINVNKQADEIVEILDEYKEIILDIYNIIKQNLNKNPIYFGISVVIEEDSFNPVGEIQDKYLQPTDDDICEINIHCGTKEEDKYYVNYITSNSKEVTANITLPQGETELNLEIISTSKFENVRNFIQKTIDINDKLAFNNDENYRTSPEEICNIIEKMKEKVQK